MSRIPIPATDLLAKRFHLFCPIIQQGRGAGAHSASSAFPLYRVASLINACLALAINGITSPERTYTRVLECARVAITTPHLTPPSSSNQIHSLTSGLVSLLIQRQLCKQHSRCLPAPRIHPKHAFPMIRLHSTRPLPLKDLRQNPAYSTSLVDVADVLFLHSFASKLSNVSCSPNITHSP